MPRSASGDQRRPRISVIVPTHRGVSTLGRCLASLARQTVPAADLEVVVVPNGPDDGTLELVDAVRDRHPELRLRVVRSERSGAARARNLGLAAATGEHVTFLDDDDWVSPTFLEALARHAEPGVVPIALVADVVEDADPAQAPSFDNYISRYLVPRAGRTFPVKGRSTALGFVAAKLVPLALARAARFDESLRSGEDVLYWHDLYAAAPFELRVCTTADHAVYYRSLRQGSVSRPGSSYDFSVDQRLDVIGRLAATEPSDPDVAALQRAMVSAQASHIGTYLGTHPDDHARVVETVADRGLSGVVSSRQLAHGMAQDLAILYAFTPYSDTSACVAARRIRERGVMVDVVSNNLGNMRGEDPSVGVMVDELVGRHHEVRMSGTAFWWHILEGFCREGMTVVERWVADKGPYRTVYSRAMLPGSHLLAALVKLRWPETHWRAEFSDPMMWNAYGQQRVDRTRAGDLRRTLAEALEERGVPVDRIGITAPHLVELVAYTLADEIHFTNEHQMEFMLDYLPEQQLVPRVREIASVHHHPTLPAEFYHRVPASEERLPGRVNIAYFGAFYLTRGLTEVTEAILALSPEERSEIALRVFTSDPAALAEEVTAKGLGDVVHPSHYVPYLEFLNLTTRMDVLLVNDARTTDHYDVNPYLPSKWSDYRGSGTDVWAIVEPGSVLSGMSTAYRSELGDVPGAVEQIRRMIAAHRAVASR